MNIIIEKRDSILRENNSAQNYFESIIENLSDSIPELTVNEPLHGDLDLSILERFSNIHTISFGPGELTSIKNIPKSVKKLQCSQNMLIGFENIPDELEELVCDKNFIEELRFANHSKLTILHAEDNKLTELKDLPKGLVEVYVDNNQIKLINFAGSTAVKVLHANNNPIDYISNVPLTLIDVQTSNYPTIESLGENRVEHEDLDHSLEYNETLHDYFKLKATYDNTLHELRKEAYYENIYKYRKTKKEAKRIIASIKPKCVNCKRPVGTIFSRKDEHYTAICGDTNLATKCSLKIDIFRGDTSSFESMFYLFKGQSERLKDKIILQKLHTLFGYIDKRKSVSLFEKALKEYNEDSAIYRTLHEKYNSIHHDDVKKTEIIEKTAQLFETMDTIQKIKDDYDADPTNTELLHDAMDMQIKVLQPQIENLRRLKYPIMEAPTSIQYIGIGGSMKVSTDLLQKSYELRDLDDHSGEPPRVIHYRMTK
jgi:hypothetical protein